MVGMMFNTFENERGVYNLTTYNSAYDVFLDHPNRFDTVRVKTEGLPPIGYKRVHERTAERMLSTWQIDPRLREITKAYDKPFWLNCYGLQLPDCRILYTSRLFLPFDSEDDVMLFKMKFG